ncbi:MAG TPA: anthranilate phosphoribosyltransferase [Terriglobales bacterium]|nr:anthranilate phosphoribosyltransferase [Terriglobales bacterium]
MADLLREALEQLLDRQDLTRAQARTLLGTILAGTSDAGAAQARDVQIAGILAALATKGETVDEIVGFAEAMRAAVADIGLKGHAPAWVDLCGTGGRARNLFNISTAASFAVAGAGLAVAKHGNRTSTSACGSADVLEAVGVNLAFPPERLGSCLLTTGVVFLYAPLLHPSMRQVMPARRALQVRTIFNLLGPLTNPAGARSQVLGVPFAPLVPKLAQALLALGTVHSFVVHSQDGLGEFSTTALNEVAEIRDNQIRHFQLDARDLGLRRAPASAFACDSRAEAVAALHRVLAGEAGAQADIVGLNAAAALVAGGHASGWDDGLAKARLALTTGRARRKLEALVQFTAAGPAGRPAAHGPG